MARMARDGCDVPQLSNSGREEKKRRKYRKSDGVATAAVAGGDDAYRQEWMDVIDAIKQRCRPELELESWRNHEYAGNDYWPPACTDRLARIDISHVPLDTFIHEYVRPSRPVVLLGCTRAWPASSEWSLKKFARDYAAVEFKVGEDDDGKAVRIPLDTYMAYLTSPAGAARDDSPLYIFESKFTSTASIEDDALCRPHKASIPDKVTTPCYFRDRDLFELINDARRPPHRWLVIGPARSGTGIHTDPVGTSAWNTLLSGHKRWCLFPPSTPRSVWDPRPRRGWDGEGVAWFHHILPQISAETRRTVGMVECVQCPGETVYVPSGWAHVVMNLDMTVAWTQNLAERELFAGVWLQLRQSRPVLSRVLLSAMRRLSQRLGCRSAEVYGRMVREVEGGLRWCPNMAPSSGSSGSESEEMGSEDERALRELKCTCIECRVTARR